MKLTTMSRRTALAALVLLCASVSVGAGEKTAALDQFFTALATKQGFSGNVLIAEQGRVVFVRSYGFADFGSRKPNVGGLKFPIGSISKLFTATAILQLVERGQLALADPVTKYLSTFPYRDIAIQDLLSHTSGLPPYNAYFDDAHNENPERIFTNADFLPGLAAKPLPLIYPPGTNGNYDNINFIVLALLVEKVSGESYADYIDKHILKPAGMSHTEFCPIPKQMAIPDNAPDFAFAHIFSHLYSDVPVRADRIPYVQGYWHAYAFNGFGDYISTTEDLLRFDQAYYGDLLLSKSMRDRAFTMTILKTGAENPAEIGLAWELDKVASGDKVVYHSGAVTGLSSVLLRDLSKRQTIILFDNAHSNARQTADQALKVLNGTAVPLPRNSGAKTYVQALLLGGPFLAERTLNTVREHPAEYRLDEGEITEMAFDLLGDKNVFHFPEEHHPREALEVLRAIVEIYPQSPEAADNYGDALRKDGWSREAVEEYRHALTLAPTDKRAKAALVDMGAESK